MKKIALTFFTVFFVGLFISTATSVSADDKLPDRYDLREVKGALPEIFSQGDLGTCWSVSSNTVYEIALRMNGIKDENGKYYKLSKIHNDMWATSYYEDGEYKNYNRVMYKGGFADYAVSYWLSGCGPVAEDRVPYDQSIESLYKKETLQPTIGKMLTGIEVVYPEGGLGEINTAWLDEDELKKAILKYGAGIASITYLGDYENKEYSSYYYNGYEPTNHEITVVGWDDNFPADHFNTTASQNGAWIIRNSWGEYNNEKGYFYVSYDDISFHRNPVTFITGISNTNYDNVYTPAGMTGAFFDGYVDDEHAKGIEYAASVFDKTANDQNIKEVMLPLIKGTKYSVYLVDEYKDTSSLSNKKLVKSGVADHNGYTLVRFTPQQIKGDKFAIVVSYSSDTKDKLILCTNATKAKKGVCYKSSNGKKWTDLAKKNETLDIYVYGSNIGKTTNVTFKTEPRYAMVTVYKNGVPQYMNPDGSYDLKKGKYTYTLLIDEKESEKYTLRVDGKKKKIKIKPQIKEKAVVEYKGTKIGASDPQDTVYIMNYSLGRGKYKADGIKEITVNGVEIEFEEFGGSIGFCLPESLEKTAGEKLEFAVCFSNNEEQKFTIKVRNGYSEMGALEISYEEALAICDDFTPTVLNMSDELADKLYELEGKYDDSIWIDADLWDEDEAVVGKVCVNGADASWDINVSLKVDTRPVMDNIIGWDAITSYARSHDNCDMEINVFDNTYVPSEFLSAIKRKDITVHFMMVNNTSYVFKGKDVLNTESFRLCSSYFKSEVLYATGSIEYDDMMQGAGFTEYISCPSGVPIKGYVEYTYDPNQIWIVFRMNEECFEKDYALNSGTGIFKIYCDENESVGLVFVGFAGDIDSTNIVDKYDLKVLKQYLDGKIGLSKSQFYKADLNFDGVVDKKDYKIIKKMINSQENSDEDKNSAA